MQKKLSVIIPVYNVEKYLKECIDSILTQTYTNLEIIIVNDASQQNEESIINEYLKQDSRIIYIAHAENLGLGGARNTGIRAATGEYLAFIDSDDWIEHNAYENIINLMEKHNAHLGIFSAIKFDQEREWIDDYFNIPLTNSKKITVSDIHLFPKSVCHKIFMRNDIINNTIFFPNYLKFEDEEFSYKYLSKVQPVAVSDTTPYLHYRVRNESITSNKSIYRNDMLQVLINIFYFLKKESLYAVYRNEVIRKFYILTYYYLEQPYAKREVFAKSINEVLKLYEVTLDEINEINPNLLAFYTSKPEIRDRILLDKYIQTCIQEQNKRNYFNSKKLLQRIQIVLLLFLTRLLKLFHLKDFASKSYHLAWDNRNFSYTPFNIQKDLIKKLDTFKTETRRMKSRIFMIGTPCHGNLGDQAIVIGEKKIVEKSHLPYIEISNDEYKFGSKILKTYTRKNDTIIIDGGGSLGTLWKHEDDKICNIIEIYKDYKIIIFPQTCYYDNSDTGKDRLKRNIQTYGKAKKLTIALRDRASFEFCKSSFKQANILFLPDAALLINDIYFDIHRDNCLLCFRNDKESIITEADKRDIKNTLKKSNIVYSFTDTIKKYHISSENRDTELKKIWKEFASSKLIITDRLHGMIFAAITNTPCLALDNISGKLSGVYQWMQHLDYIKVCESMNELKDNIDKFYNKNNSIYNNKIIIEKYDILLSLI